MAAVTHSDFLALPRELRDHIHDLVAVDEDSLRIKDSTSSDAKDQLISKCPLLLVCKQAHSEYLASLLKTALAAHNTHKITTTATECDFGDTLAFLAALSKKQFEALKKASNFHVVIALGSRTGHVQQAAQLKSWLEYCEATGCNPTYRVSNAKSAVSKRPQIMSLQFDLLFMQRGSEDHPLRKAIREWVKARMSNMRREEHARRIEQARAEVDSDEGTDGRRGSPGE